MATCGSPTPLRARHGRLPPPRSRGGILFCLVVSLLLGGCLNRVQYGFPPKVSHLSDLQRGRADRGDVLLALGEPRGYGLARFSPRVPPRDIWFYEFVQAEGTRSSLAMLLVFFDRGTYDGYLWFSSAMLLERK